MVELLANIPDSHSRIGSLRTWRKSEIRHALAKAIEALPKTERLIASLYYSDELTPKEIAAVMGTSEAAISRLYTIAMLRIQGKLRN